MKQPFNIVINRFKGINLYLDEFNLPEEYALNVEGYIPHGDKLVADSASVLVASRPASTYSWLDYTFIYNDNQDNQYRVLFGNNGSGSYECIITNVSDFTADVLTFTLDTAADHIPAFFMINGELRIKNALSCTSGNIIVKYFDIAQFNNGITFTGLSNESSDVSAPGDSTYFSGVFTESGNDDSVFLKDDVIEYSFSYIYDDLQEGLLGTSISHIMTADKADLSIALTLNGAVHISKRVTAINVYRRINNSKWYYLSQIDINDSTWTYDSVAGTADITITDSGSVLTDTYNARTGVIDGKEFYDSVSNNYHINWETATVNIGRAFYGNVKVNEDVYGSTLCTEYNDRIYFSDPGKFDVIKRWNYLDLGTGDGDQIVHLDSYGSEVLVFKEHNLYIFNAGSLNAFEWRLVAKRSGVKLTDWRAITHTPYGLVFISNNNLYLYTGNGQIQEIAREIRGYVSKSVVYSPEYNSLFVYYSNGDYWYTYLISFEYDFIVRSTYYTETSATFMQMFTDYNGTASVLIWNGESTNIEIKTLTAGDTSVYQSGKFVLAGMQKRIKALYITAKGNGVDIYISSKSYLNQDFGADGSTIAFYPNVQAECFYVKVENAGEINQIIIQGEEYNK